MHRLEIREEIKVEIIRALIAIAREPQQVVVVEQAAMQSTTIIGKIK